MIRLRPSGADEVLIKRVRDWYEPGPGVFIAPQALFSPALLFTTGVNGTWYDPSDLNTLYQDAAGTTPCTAVEQPVGLMLDKSKGLVLGVDIKASGTTALAGSATAATYNTSTGVGAVSRVDSANQSYVTWTGLVPLAFYKISLAVSSGNVNIRSGSNAGVVVAVASATATTTYYAYADTSGQISLTSAVSGSTAVFTVSTFNSILGNHAFNSSGNSANFPVLSARYNLLTKTEQFDDVVWSSVTGAGGSVTRTANTSVAPDGTTTADRLVIVNAGNFALLQQVVTVISGAPRSFGLWIKSNTSSNQTFSIGDDQGTTLSVTATSAWTFVQHSQTIASTTGKFQILGNAGTTDILVWGADMRYTNDALNQPAYQRVNTATDYDTVGFKPYLRFNGVNQWLQTNSIDFSYGDKMFVCAGVRKLSDAVRGVLAELGVASNGAFQINAPTASLNGYLFQNTGTNGAGASITGYASPITNILSGIGDISGDQSILRVNGTQAASSTADQGTGNYGNYPLYIGARAGSSLWFNGRLHQLVVAGKQASASEISSTETYTNTKTGAY